MFREQVETKAVVGNASKSAGLLSSLISGRGTDIINDIYNGVGNVLGFVGGVSNVVNRVG